MKLLILTVCAVVVVNCHPKGGIHQILKKEKNSDEENIPYSFSYAIADHDSEGFYGQEQQRDENGHTSGFYYLLSPDNVWRKISYSDTGSGFKTEASEHPKDHPPQEVSFDTFAVFMNTNLFGKAPGNGQDSFSLLQPVVRTQETISDESEEHDNSGEVVARKQLFSRPSDEEDDGDTGDRFFPIRQKDKNSRIIVTRKRIISKSSEDDVDEDIGARFFSIKQNNRNSGAVSFGSRTKEESKEDSFDKENIDDKTEENEQEQEDETEEESENEEEQENEENKENINKEKSDEIEEEEEQEKEDEEEQENSEENDDIHINFRVPTVVSSKSFFDTPRLPVFSNFKITPENKFERFSDEKFNFGNSDEIFSNPRLFVNDNSLPRFENFISQTFEEIHSPNLPRIVAPLEPRLNTFFVKPDKSSEISSESDVKLPVVLVNHALSNIKAPVLNSFNFDQQSGELKVDDLNEDTLTVPLLQLNKLSSASDADLSTKIISSPKLPDQASSFGVPVLGSAKSTAEAANSHSGVVSALPGSLAVLLEDDLQDTVITISTEPLSDQASSFGVSIPVLTSSTADDVKSHSDIVSISPGSPLSVLPENFIIVPELKTDHFSISSEAVILPHFEGNVPISNSETPLSTNVDSSFLLLNENPIVSLLSTSAEASPGNDVSSNIPQELSFDISSNKITPIATEDTKATAAPVINLGTQLSNHEVGVPLNLNSPQEGVTSGNTFTIVRHDVLPDSIEIIGNTAVELEELNPPIFTIKGFQPKAPIKSFEMIPESIGIPLISRTAEKISSSETVKPIFLVKENNDNLINFNNGLPLPNSSGHTPITFVIENPAGDSGVVPARSFSLDTIDS